MCESVASYHEGPPDDFVLCDAAWLADTEQPSMFC